MACSHLQVATEDSSEVIRACIRVPTTFDWSILDHIRPIIRSSIRIRKIVPKKKNRKCLPGCYRLCVLHYFVRISIYVGLAIPHDVGSPIYVPPSKTTMKLKERQRKSKGCIVAKLNKSSEKSKKRWGYFSQPVNWWYKEGRDGSN